MVDINIYHKKLQKQLINQSASFMKIYMSGIQQSIYSPRRSSFQNIFEDTFVLIQDNKIIQFQMNCLVCLTPYHSQTNQPFYVCSQHHSVCKGCLQGFKKGQKCPSGLDHPTSLECMIVNEDLCKKLHEAENDPKPDERAAQDADRPKERPLDEIEIKLEVLQAPAGNNSGNVLQNTSSIQNIKNEQRYQQSRENFYSQDQREPEKICQCYCNDLSQKQKALFIAIYLSQFTFTVCNLYFPLSRPTQDCMDSPYGPGGTTLREWILNIGITEMVLMGLGLLVVFFYKIRLSNERCFELCSYFLLILLALKVVVWAGVQCALFNYGMGNLCTGGLFAYGIVMVTIHLLFLCVTGILAYCALQR